jgi:hypothetical protein
MLPKVKPAKKFILSLPIKFDTYLTKGRAIKNLTDQEVLQIEKAIKGMGSCIGSIGETYYDTWQVDQIYYEMADYQFVKRVGLLH